MTAIEILIETAKQAQCDCSKVFINGTHRIGCWLPHLRNAIENAEKVRNETIRVHKLSTVQVLAESDEWRPLVINRLTAVAEAAKAFSNVADDGTGQWIPEEKEALKVLRQALGEDE